MRWMMLIKLNGGETKVASIELGIAVLFGMLLGVVPLLSVNVCERSPNKDRGNQIIF